MFEWFKKRTANLPTAGPGGKDSMTPEEQAAADKAAQEKAIKDLIDSSVKEALKPLGALSETVKSLADNQKILADTLQKLPPAPAAKKEGEGAAGDAAKPLTAEQIQKLIADGVAAAQQQQQQTAEQRAAREAFVNGDESGLKNLPPEFKEKLTETDLAKRTEQAKAIVASWEKFAKDNGVVLKNLGGANREGGSANGNSAGEGANDATGSGGDANKWSFVQMPGQTATSGNGTAGAAGGAVAK